MNKKEEQMNLSKKEKEIMKSYADEDEFEAEDFEFESETNDGEDEKEFEIIKSLEDDSKEKKKKKNKTSKRLNIIFTIFVILVVMVGIDIVAVKKFDKGPFFAIPLKTYEDGGTKEYYGLGYKVIKYHQLQGRRDTAIGTWGLKYNSETIELDAIDLAIEFNDDAATSFKKYDGKFLKVSGVLSNVSMNENTITISYIDEGGKYSLDILCDMASSKDNLENFETDIRITAIGTLSKFDYKTPDMPTRLYLNDCFAEQ